MTRAMLDDQTETGSAQDAEKSAELAPQLAELQAELEARDKTIRVLIARVEGQFARRDSAIAVLEQNISLEQQVKRRTRELEESHASLSRTLSELKLAQAQLLESNKLEAIGQLAAGVAHEINTPIQYVSDNTSFLDTAFQRILLVLDETARAVRALGAAATEPDPWLKLEERFRAAKLDWLRAEVPRAIAQSMEGLGRVSSIVSAMKEFSHPSTADKELIDLHEAIATTVTVARHEWKYVAEVATVFDARIARVPCHRNELNQVVLNLVVNAAHAIAERTNGGAGGKGSIVIETELVGAEVEIRVRDDGTGMSKEVASRIFDPFFTTKPVGKGTGQGLAIARSVVVDKHGGTIRCESTPGLGTCFFVRLPMASSASESPSVRAVA